MKTIGFFYKRCVSGIVFLLLFGTISAQELGTDVTIADDQQGYLDFKTGWFFGADYGRSLMYGDVTTYNIFPKFGDFKKSFGDGFSIFGGKKIKFGLSAEIQLNSGSLKGIKTSVANNPFFFNAEYKSYSISAKYNLSDLFFRELGKRPKSKNVNRLNIYFTLGAGQVFYRSVRNFMKDNRLSNETYGYSKTTVNQPTGQHLLGKEKALNTLIVPIGMKFQYKLNYKTDIAFDLNYFIANTDKIDAWKRDFSSKDRYAYMGVGLVYNFGRNKDADEVPSSLKLGGKKKKSSSSSSNGDVTTPSQKGSIFGRKRRSVSNENSAEDDLNLKLKLLESQLKLLEMQRMMDPKK